MKLAQGQLSDSRVRVLTVEWSLAIKLFLKGLGWGGGDSVRKRGFNSKHVHVLSPRTYQVTLLAFNLSPQAGVWCELILDGGWGTGKEADWLLIH